MEGAARRWLARGAEAFLERVGVRKGQTVLDFGCDKGNYTLPAARLVGKGGKVYALDKNGEALRKLEEASKQDGLDNVECLHVADEGNLPLPDGSVDVVLLYDVLHGGYFPEPEQRMKVLNSIYRVLKPGGLLSLYPTHLRRYGMTWARVLSEVTSAGFDLVGDSRRLLVHNSCLTRGRILTFRKPADPR